MIASLDGGGVVTLHFPGAPGGSTALQAEGAVRLAQSYELDAEGFKVVADDLVTEAGVRPLLHRAFAVPVLEGDAVTGVIVEAGGLIVTNEIAWHMDKFAYLVAKMRDTPEGAGTLLDNPYLASVGLDGYTATGFLALGPRMLAEQERWIVEGAAGVALAALLKERQRFAGQRCVVVLCGRNIAAEKMRELWP